MCLHRSLCIDQGVVFFKGVVVCAVEAIWSKLELGEFLESSKMLLENYKTFLDISEKF